MGLYRWKQSLLRPLQHLLGLKSSIGEELVGVDIGPGFIKLLKMDKSDDFGFVEAFAYVPLAEGAIAKDEIQDLAAVSTALRLAFDAAQVKSKSVALAIPRASVIIKTIAISKKLSSVDIESRAWVEANHHFPDLVGDIYLDFDILGPSSQDSAQWDLLLVACRKDQIKPYLDLLQSNGLKTEVIDVNCYALERALSLIKGRLPPLKTLALLNLDYNNSSLIVLHEEQMIYAHDHSFEGLHFATQVRQFLEQNPSINKDQADALAKVSAYQDILKARLTAHLRHSMHFFYSSRPHITIQKLVLSGDCAALPYLQDFIQKETGIDTILANPFEGMELASSINEQMLKEHASALMLCSGLALSRLKGTAV